MTDPNRIPAFMHAYDAAKAGGLVVIRKGGYFYRPDWCGYTSSILEAGYYDRAEAEKQASEVEGVTVHDIASFELPRLSAYDAAMFAKRAQEAPPGSDLARLHRIFQNAEDVIEALQNQVTTLRTSIDRLLVCGNHIALYRTDRWPDYKLDGLTRDQQCEHALRILGATQDYDMWCCWSGMMQERDGAMDRADRG